MTTTNDADLKTYADELRAKVEPHWLAAYDRVPDDHPTVVARIRSNPYPLDPREVVKHRHYGKLSVAQRDPEAIAAITRAQMYSWTHCHLCGGPSTGRTARDASCGPCQRVAYLLRAQADADQRMADGRTRRAIVEADLADELRVAS